MFTDTLDQIDDGDITTELFQGGQLEWIGEPHDNDWGFEPRSDVQGHADLELSAYWAQLIARPPEGSVYFEGYLIVHNRADMVKLMRELEREYNYYVSQLDREFGAASYHDLGWV